MSMLDELRGVLCDPEDKCCITGSDEDRAIVDRGLASMAKLIDALKTAQWMLERDYIDDQKMSVINKCRMALEDAGVSA